MPRCMDELDVCCTILHKVHRTVWGGVGSTWLALCKQHHSICSSSVMEELSDRYNIMVS